MTSLYVSGFHVKTRARDLALFVEENVGRIRDLDIPVIKKPTEGGPVQPYAFVKLQNSQLSREAVRKLHNTIFKGNRLQVTISYGKRRGEGDRDRNNRFVRDGFETRRFDERRNFGRDRGYRPEFVNRNDLRDLIPEYKRDYIQQRTGVERSRTPVQSRSKSPIRRERSETPRSRSRSGSRSGSRSRSDSRSRSGSRQTRSRSSSMEAGEIREYDKDTGKGRKEGTVETVAEVAKESVEKIAPIEAMEFDELDFDLDIDDLSFDL